MPKTSLSTTHVAALYDIHGNLPALEAVLREIGSADVAHIVIGGDVAAGPMPAETVDRLMTLGDRATFIMGNADREVVAAFDRLQAGDPVEDAELAWIARQLTHGQRDFLASFRPHVRISTEELGSMLFCHGSPRSDEEILTATTPPDRLRRALEGVTADVVVCGHTHVQFDRSIEGTRVVNAGSVGMPYEGSPGARWALLGPGVDLRQTAYDLEAAAGRIRAGGSPAAEAFVRDVLLQPASAEEATVFFERMARERAE